MLPSNPSPRTPSAAVGRRARSLVDARVGSRSRALLVALLVAVVSALPAREAYAQMRALPVLQNAFASRGFAAAANYGSESGARTYGVAGAYASPGSRYVVSVGIGSYDPTTAGISSRANYGARIALMGPRFLDRRAGIAVFGGYGIVPKKGDQSSITMAPAGLAVGYRHALGASRGFSVYAAPFYAWSRSRAADGSTSGGLFRVSGGVDVGLTRQLGVTIGAESGATARAGKPGPTGTVFGVGLAYAFRG